MADRVGRQRCKVSDAFIDMYRRDAFEHIALFYNPRRTHRKNLMLSPISFEE
jgi:transposase InsO family protein